MRTLTVTLISALMVLGCARVQMEAPKDPIKLDISMRLDVYQHVQKDIDEIENIVSGADKPQSKAGPRSFFVTEAYAQDLSPEVEQAALRRRNRRAQLVAWQVKGVIGENGRGLVEVRDSAAADASVQALVDDENADRTTIYQQLAAKNGTSVGEVQKVYAERLRADAAPGTPVETGGGWTVKN